MAFSYFGGRANPGVAAGFALANDANRSKPRRQSGATQALPNQSMPIGAAGSWRLVRTTAATAGTGEAAILHTADIERSDPRLAGLMFCDAESKASKLSSSWSTLFATNHLTHAGTTIPIYWTIIPTGVGLVVSGDATCLVTGPWQTPRVLEIKVIEGGAPIDGVVALLGLPKVLQSLTAECVQK